MMVNRYVSVSRDRFSLPRRRDDEEPVRNDLAVTPSKMLELVDLNVPISSQNAGLTFDEGYGKLDFDPPAEYTRGVDIGDLWELRMSVKDKFRRLRDEGRFNVPPEPKGGD